MTIGNNISKVFVKTLSGLGNNSDSIIPMATKDTISNCAIVDTYRKEGGKDDARERFIEEFGTGVVWLFGIPALKKVIDKFVYPIFGLDPKLDPRILKDEQSGKIIGEALQNSAVSKHEAEIFNTLKNPNKIIKNLTNEQMYKGMFIGKFALATGLSAIALSKIIQYKQKTTNKRIEKDFYTNTASTLFVLKDINHNENFKNFTGKKEENQNKGLSFKGALQFFMYNPIGNTSILDGVITTTRLKEARHGERKEVGLKEAFQIIFIYCLAKPIEMAFEGLGKLLKLPVSCDPMVIFDKDLKGKLDASKDTIDDLLKSDNLKEEFYKLNAKNNPLIELLENNGTISTVKDKNGAIESLSFINYVKENDLKKALQNLAELNNLSKNIKGIKVFKTIAVLGNVAIAAWAMGRLQPKVNIWMRKLLNNGDNRNPAIVEQEKQMQLNILNA